MIRFCTCTKGIFMQEAFATSRDYMELIHGKAAGAEKYFTSESSKWVKNLSQSDVIFFLH